MSKIALVVLFYENAVRYFVVKINSNEMKNLNTGTLDCVLTFKWGFYEKRFLKLKVKIKNSSKLWYSWNTIFL
jgi:hypothetical protein